jgi:hypothetical protein
MAQKRKAIPKKTRFEVFKRDSFTCQHCGRKAPDVVLQIDHLKPVSKGGTNDILNLVTACEGCNAGKSNRELSDDSILNKQRQQLEKLQERKEQIEMMMEWWEGLQEIKEQTVDKLSDYWHELAPGFTTSDHGKRNIKKWLRQYSLDEIKNGMEVAAEQYLEFKQDGTVTDKSWNVAFKKIPAICRVDRESKQDPDLKELFYIRGIVRNKCDNYFDNPKCFTWLRTARSWGVPMTELRQIALRTRYWSHFEKMIEDIINEYKAPEGDE